MARYGRSCESRFRQNVFIKPNDQRELVHFGMAGKRRPKVNFKKAFDWFSFNRTFLEPARGHRIAIAIDPCHIPKSGKKTPGVDWFWSGCASAMKKGLEILGISIVDANARAFARQQGMDLSVGSTKTLLHNAAMVERFISMSGKHADMRFNNTDFKELLFYGVRAAV